MSPNKFTFNGNNESACMESPSDINAYKCCDFQNKVSYKNFSI